MSFLQSWIAVQGVTREQALDVLGMEVSDVQAELFEGVALIERPDGWLLVLSDDDEDAFGGVLARLAPLGRAAVAYGLDAETYCSACGYEAGRDVWSVTVNPSKRVFRVVGQPPAQLDPIIAEAKAEQANTDVDLFFQIPAKLAQSICGFRLGEDDPATIRYTSLKSTGVRRQEQIASATQGRGFFARLFGRS
jgi:hypothetical protein